jgi:hypothetical protein
MRGRIFKTDQNGGVINGEGNRNDIRFRWRDCDSSLKPSNCGHDTEVEFSLIEGRGGCRYQVAINVSVASKRRWRYLGE